MAKVKIITDREESADIIRSAMSAEIKRLEVGLNSTNKEIEKFENQYKIASENFLKNFTADDLRGGDNEYIRWAGELKIRDRILEDLRRLKDIEYVAD